MMRKFKDLTKAEKRTKIAKDTLKYLDQGRLKPKSDNQYVQGIFKENIPMKRVLKERKICTVCELGGLFYSSIMLENGLMSIRDLHEEFCNREGIALKRLRKYFTKHQIALIEAAFERTNDPNTSRNFNISFWMRTIKEDMIFLKAENFGKKYKSDKKRFRAILENIIDNKGTFKP